ncbi:hypothetical protein [Nocardioides sp. B-3]|uniref:hypothetical protein n=1 Tax=Nocardioides sp. B-3 TaxID=2895565 RepID=UPI002152DFBA|nr:hypothetical protein [Nocardioides sp. B-3]UUZ61905.1 hypothetical protein LP418_23655 [Nocardioides sp. B-3]
MGKLQRLIGRHDADGLAIGSDKPDLGNVDPLVDSQLGADVSSSDLGWWWTLTEDIGPEMNNGSRFAQAEASVTPTRNLCA